MGRPGPTLDGLLRLRMKPADRPMSGSGSRDQMDSGRSGFQSRPLLQNSRLDSDLIRGGSSLAICGIPTALEGNIPPQLARSGLLDTLQSTSIAGVTFGPTSGPDVGVERGGARRSTCTM